jgi:hypothetical protein
MAKNPRVEGFVASLSNNRAGRVLANHLASLEARTSDTGAHDGPVAEAIGNERVFMHALGAAVYGTRAYPCGLTMPLPRFLAILNLSGERMLVYSDNPSLISTLCTRSSALHASDLASCLQAFETFPMPRTPDCCKFVLLTYSMPWQAGTDAAFWHLSACSIDMSEGSDPTLAERMLSFSGMSVKPFAGKPVLDPSDKHIRLDRAGEELDLMTLKQIEAFEEAYSATCLDMAVYSTAPVEPKVAQLLGLTQQLQRDRARDQAEIKRLRAGLQGEQTNMLKVLDRCEQERMNAAAAHSTELEKVRSTHDEQLLLGKQQYSALHAELEGLQSSFNKASADNARTRKGHDKLAAKCEELKRQTEGKDKVQNAALAKHRAEIVQLETSLEAATTQASTLKARLDKEHAHLVMRQQTLHTASLDKTNAALASKERLLDQLSDNNERLSVEALSLKSHDEEQAATIARLEAELAAATALASAAPASRGAGTSTRNASTATHHCASTQTAPLPATEPPATVAPPRNKGRPNLQAYQTAIDTLQELVNTSRGGRSALQDGYSNGYPIPLPFPHFMPNGHRGTYPRHS